MENRAEKLEAQLEETLRKITAEDREAEEALTELAREIANPKTRERLRIDRVHLIFPQLGDAK